VRSAAPGVPLLALSALAAGAAEALGALIKPGQTAALLGSSGVGKSTLVNLLLRQDRQRVQPVRESDSRGRHTTTIRELLPLPGGGALIDTPGMRELQLWAGSDSLDASFEDVTALALECRFRDCGHDGEQGCGIERAVREGRLPEARWLSYRKLRAEVAWHERKSDPLEAQKVKRRWKQIHKAMRHDYKRDV
jgi:ribosome biogenesis GTPase / thiamine phosphate phosphatase